MKRSPSIIGYLMLTWITIFFNIDLVSFSQGEMAEAPFQYDELILKIPKSGLIFTMTDTILPTICNSGQGLVHYKCLSIREIENDYNYNFMGGINSAAIPADYTEAEILILKERQRLMDEQSQSELQKQIKKDKMDIGLGEIIKGFYMKPIY